MLLDVLIIQKLMLALLPDEFLEIPNEVLSNQNVTLFRSFLLFQVPQHLQTFISLTKTHLNLPEQTIIANLYIS